MAKKRKLDASLPDEVIAETPPEPKGQMGGLWAGSAMNMLKQRIDSAHSSLHKGVMAGTVALELEPDQIEDAVGSDRMTDWVDDEDFEALVANIKRRGQTQPIRVRPTDKNWEADPDNPLETNDKFYIQSGRRRLAACRRLGRKVLALVSTDEGDRALADLEERFHENTMRRDLNGFEELISIGLLAEGLQELTQKEVAERLGIPQSDVSLGAACLEWRDVILRRVDIATTPKRQYRKIIPQLKRGDALQNTLPKVLQDSDTELLDVRGIPMVAKKGRKGYTLQVKHIHVPEDQFDKMVVDISKVIHAYTAGRGIE